jgi:Tol biopolymer transport system component/DNA-binding winged helix-turn-helix (wHTH) protein
VRHAPDSPPAATLATPPAAGRIRFQDFEADLRTEELFRSGRKIRLPHQSFVVLAILLERPGQLVSRDELQAKVWPAGTLVEYDQGLNAVVKRLREALHDSAETPRFIETLPKRGYRFIAQIHSEVASPTPVVLTATQAPVDVSAARQSATKSSSRKLWFAGAGGLAAILLVASVVWIFTQRSTLHAPSARQVVPLTSLPGQEVAPTFSPDGSQIAFAWNGADGAGHQFDLYVKSLSSERLLRLTQHPSTWLVPSWSPDGSTIAFLRTDGQRPESGIYVVPALGGTERRVVGNGVAVGSFRQLSWSPDGRTLAYSAYGPAGVAQIYFVALDSLQIQPLSPAPDCLDATAAAFAPNGKQLAMVCISSLAVYSIDVVDLPHGPVRRLATIMGYPHGLAWSKEGDRLIVANDGGDGGELWQLTLDGELSQLPFGEKGSAPTVSRNGRMAYVRGQSTVNIWRADLTAADPEQSATKLIFSTLTQIVPRYSADGSRIAFESNRSGSMEIWTADAQGNDPDRLTSFNGPATSSPSWCSDGRRIAFDSRASGVSDIYVADINERVPRKVVTSEANLSFPTWSADCRWLFAHNGKNNLYRFPSSGGRAERVAESSSYSAVIGDRLIFNVTEPDGVVLWTKPSGGGTQQRLENMPKVRYDDGWAATANGIYYTDSSGSPVTVNFYDLATRTRRQLMTLKQTPVPGVGPGITVSPDGRWLLYTQVDNEQSEIILAPEQ